MKGRPKGERAARERSGPPSGKRSAPRDRSGPPTGVRSPSRDRFGAPGGARSAPRDRSGPPTGERSGPRARAAQQRTFGDPYQRAERPARERLTAPGGAGIRLDPDVARVFRDSESVNEALRLVLRLARLAGGRPPAFDRGPPGERRGPPRGPRPGPAPRATEAAAPRFEDFDE
jgi:hypothetical protein